MQSATKAGVNQPSGRSKGRCIDSPMVYLRHLKDVEYVIEKLRANRTRFLVAAACRRQRQLGSFASRQAVSPSNRIGSFSLSTPQLLDSESPEGGASPEDRLGGAYTDICAYVHASLQQDVQNNGELQEAFPGCLKKRDESSPLAPYGVVRHGSGWMTVTQESLQTSAITNRGDDLDTYLAELLVPLLHDGLVALCRVVELLIADASKKRLGTEYHKRFNPLCWLGQYLLRHHPAHPPRMHQPANAEDAYGELGTSPAADGTRGVRLQQRLNCAFAPFYQLVKDIVDDERARRDFLLREEEVQHVFEAYRQEKAHRAHYEEGGGGRAAENQCEDTSRNSDAVLRGDDVEPLSKCQLQSDPNQDGIMCLTLEDCLLPDIFKDGSAGHKRRSHAYCRIRVENIEEVLDRLDTFWELGGRMVQQFQENSPRFFATKDAAIISYLLPQQQAELVIEDANDVQVGEFWLFLKNYTEVQTWIRRELFNKRRQEMQLQPESNVRRALVEGLKQRNMIVVEKENDGDKDQDAGFSSCMLE
ncbi:hypothetical protein TGRUB_252260 [Toxoplasma gondii RUB]|uniref:Uncharacterized protein n=10 Tax=Toxoplasma gondii TaxID=5811 RepID=A0A125YK62_TOXGV|nr:hypothetical protein TGGT1_252260 [Toxoplasma gondii GT1]ESS30237.1 hypothetical protein TGVEG_252260 [Toxoplasma gondii VEG]KAF4645455.1 hypothetical protein TGRH88_005590 [Toxoplasma gondii]KFG29678.1 hypothetical protein TGDOM2_252260 [Toxoplasma gondii GAB2-2007-GAL-DOM2]KFG37184.1 hypothetical protein TGFOU_252260 [Toxoplasma gondii FOU]KFG47393.1 hypothetical protein TGP89_252260 [Toxoplasma gondii p89]KFG57957.1 hypothetical protein TGRUB_252260 [Toxoplasma gondii RUB]KFH02349.1 hy